MVNDYVFEITNICIHGKGLLRKTTKRPTIRKNWRIGLSTNSLVVLPFEVTVNPAASNIFVLVNSVGTARRLEQKLEFLPILILDWTVVIFFSSDGLFACRKKLNSLAIDWVCRQIHLPHATFSHAQSLHRTDDTCALAQSIKGELRPKKNVHPRVMFHLAPHSTLNTSTSSLLPTFPVLHSSTFSDSRPVAHASIYSKDPT